MYHVAFTPQSWIRPLDLGLRGHLCVYFRYGPMTCSPSQGWLCQSTPCTSFPPRMRFQLQGSDFYPGGPFPTEHISLLLDMRLGSPLPLHGGVRISNHDRGCGSKRCMGRTEFPDLQPIGSEPLVGYGTFSNRAKWSALRSARISMLKKGLDTADIVRDACFHKLISRVNSLFSRIPCSYNEMSTITAADFFRLHEQANSDFDIHLISKLYA